MPQIGFFAASILFFDTRSPQIPTLSRRGSSCSSHQGEFGQPTPCTFDRWSVPYKSAGRTPNPLVTSWSRATERSLQFVRWLRYCLNHSRSWRLEIEQLKPYMKAYIC
jgi:hypothetical protein